MNNAALLLLAILALIALATDARIMRGKEEISALQDEETLEDLLFWERQLKKSSKGSKGKKGKASKGGKR
jgi:hypothetical protein